MGIPPFATGLLALFFWAFWLAMIVFWVVVGWRAMRALEGIDESLRERATRQ
jgi:hypothetical protein